MHASCTADELPVRRYFISQAECETRGQAMVVFGSLVGTLLQWSVSRELMLRACRRGDGLVSVAANEAELGQADDERTAFSIADVGRTISIIGDEVGGKGGGW